MMMFVGAFVACGMICMLGQLLYEFLPNVELPKFFFALAIIGAVLTPCGAMAALGSLGPAGPGILITGLGQSICESVWALVALGDPVRLVIMAVLLVVLTLIGVVTAKALYKKASK